MGTSIFVGDVIRSARKQHQLARIDLQRLSGLSEATIARAERGGAVSARTAELLGRALGIDPALLRPEGGRP
jgi:transcriptional regulator with XRE-family HTH domain